MPSSQLPRASSLIISHFPTRATAHLRDPAPMTSRDLSFPLSLFFSFSFFPQGTASLSREYISRRLTLRSCFVRWLVLPPVGLAIIVSLRGDCVTRFIRRMRKHAFYNRPRKITRTYIFLPLAVSPSVPPHVARLNIVLYIFLYT